MALYELTKTAITELAQTTFPTQYIDERYDLQRLLRQQIEVIAPDTLIIAEEFCEWDESKRRVDLLGVDRDANLVVVELKRTEDGGHMELQAIRYAAMVSAMTDGEVTAEDFRDKASKLQAKLGGKYNLRRYYCDDGEIFHITGRTYALSNQWSVNTMPVVDQVIAKLPPGSLSYAKTSEAD